MNITEKSQNQKENGGQIEKQASQEKNGQTVDINLVSYYDEHWYKVSRKDQPDDYFPSVTTKLSVVAKDFLAKWRGDIGNREADMRLFESQNRGTRIHSAWETLTTGGVVLYQNWKHPNYSQEAVKEIEQKHDGKICLIPYQDEYLDVLKLYKFLDVVKPKILASELVLYSDIHKEAGTIDNVFEIKEGSYLIDGKEPVELVGGIYIADLKTGKSFDDTAYLQMAAYANMYTERTGQKVVGTLGMHTQAKARNGIEGFAGLPRIGGEVAQDFQDFRHVSEMWLRKNKNSKPRNFTFPAMLSLNK